MFYEGFILQRAYKFSILYFGIFVTLLLISGIMIIAQKSGLNFEGVLHYYLGSKEEFLASKSDIGLLKIVLPHIFAFALLSMVLLHFLAFTKYKTKSKALIYLLFIVQILEIFSPFLILHLSDFFVYIKLTSLFFYTLTLSFVFTLLVISIVKH